MSPAAQTFLNVILFIVVPYVAVAVFFLVTIFRYFKLAFSYSSLSSQFLENKQHFWGVVPFHYGIITILTGHLIGFLIPRSVLAWNSVPLRLYVLEVSALIFGLLTLVGLVSIVFRRWSVRKVRIVTTKVDWILYALLAAQVITGVSVAIFNGWGSSWFAVAAAPYLLSLLLFQPDIAFVTPMPFIIQAHIIGAFLLIGLFPFTRLVHVLVVPNHYLIRKAQVVRWYGIKRLQS